MTISPNTKKALENIGLNISEIKAIATLIKSKGIIATDLSQEADIPHSRVYETLRTLEEKEWVGSDDSRPTKYFLKSPSTGVQTMKQRIEAEFVQNQNIILNELVPLYEKSGTNERPDIWVLSGVNNIVAKISEMVDMCQNEVMIAVPELGEGIVKLALPKLRTLHEKGVSITVLTSDQMNKDSIKSIKRVADVKVKRGLFGGGIIADKRYVVILLGPEMGSPDSTEIVAIWADHAGLAVFARQYFEYLLKDSKKV